MENIYIRGSLYVVGAYLAGSIPFGMIIAFVLGGGVDPRNVGSGNIGATNVSRVVGKTGGILTLLLDGLKGFIPLFVARRAFPENYFLIVSLCGGAAFIGHIFPIYLRFKGGKGVATAFGIITFMSPVTALMLILIFAVVLFLSGYVSVGSMISAVAFPMLMAFLGPSPLYVALALFMAIMIIFTHRENIRRLIEGREDRFVRKREDR